MKAFLDTNVVLDLLLDGRVGRSDAEEIFALAAYGDIEAIVSPVTFANAAYFLERAFGPVAAREKVSQLRSLVGVSTDDATTVDQALGLVRWPDFEDAMQYTSALSARAEVIITNNVSDFLEADIVVQTPADFLQGR